MHILEYVSRISQNYVKIALMYMWSDLRVSIGKKLFKWNLYRVL